MTSTGGTLSVSGLIHGGTSVTYPDPAAYEKLAAEYDLIPVCKEILADTETPVSVLGRFADSENAFLLESMEGGETWGRYSFVGVDPELLFEAEHNSGSGKKLTEIRHVYRDLRVAPVDGLPRFFGGTVGFIAYEAIGEFERMPAPKIQPGAPVPRSCFLEVDKLIVFDSKRHTVKIVICTRPAESDSVMQAYEDALAEIESISARITGPHPGLPSREYSPATFASNMTRDEYTGIVERTKKYIVDGDIIQAVLSQRFSAISDVPPIQVYRALRLLNPSPYTFFLKIGDETLVGSSPEVMVRLTGSRVELRPIAGTRPRGLTEQADRKLADELLSDEKEKAEHVMLVDLGRNDLGRVSETGSVQVTEYMVIERYSHVMHLVSHVEGILRREFDAYDVIKATFPAGTLSGAPKIRAMEVINELEPEPRGAYGGAVGYVSYNGNMDLAITIRTLEMTGNRISVQAGAGIVFDSNPGREFEETEHKARGMQKAVAMAVNGLKVGEQ